MAKQNKTPNDKNVPVANHESDRAQKYYKLGLYLVVIILINVVANQLFFRVDITANGLYSLSDASKRVVSTLKEPLTINVFFSKNLPAPYNTIEPYLHDLLREYEANSNNNLSFRFFDVTAKEGDVSEETEENRTIAQDYGIYPVAVRSFEQDQAKVQQSYMGIALIHGDVVEKIPAIKSTEGLEFTITNAIQKMNNKISALANLPEKIKVTLVTSSSLRLIAPLIKLEGLETIKSQVQAVIERVQPKAYGNLQFVHIDPTVGEGTPEQLKPFERIGLRWPDVAAPNGQTIPAGEGKVALALSYGGKTIDLNLLRQKMALTNRGLEEQYVLLTDKEIEMFINENIDNLIEVNEDLGYLSSHGAAPLVDNTPPQMRMFQRQMAQALTRFNDLLSRQYTVKEIKLDDGIPDGIETLVIAGVKQEFNDWELYQIDQFLMKGKSLAIFLDAFNEIQSQQQGGFQQPFYLPLNTGIEKLLNHYGVKVVKSYVLDENCYINRGPDANDMPIYFAPLIKNEKINHRFDFMDNIKQLFVVKASPLEADEELIKKNNLTLHTLISSSDKSWEMSGRINLMPFMIQPPKEEDKKKSYPLAYLLEGEFPSYFTGKPIPAKPEKKEKEETEENFPGMQPQEEEKPEDKEQEKKEVIKSGVLAQQETVTKGKPGKIFLIATSEMVKDTILDEEGVSPNAVFLMNIIDYLNAKEDIAVMRGKNQQFNPLKADISPFVKNLIKIFNIAGLPVLFILIGVIIWVRRMARKRKIQSMFSR